MVAHLIDLRCAYLGPTAQTVAILRGGPGALPPTAQNVLNFMQFSENLAKPHVGVPSNGNPGSAPDIDLSNVFTWVLLPLIPYLLVSTQFAFD